jgi:Bacteriophage related domain of unknown function
MALQQVVDAVEARLAERWTLCPVLEMNVFGEAPETGEAFLLLQFPVSRITRLSVGTRYYREEGGIRFVLHLPRGEGTAKALDWSRQLADIFRDQKFGGVTTKVPTSPFLDDNNDVGNYFTAAVVCQYTYDFVD